MNTITHYVAGFLFSPNLKQVALIRKNKPAWQAGKLNGIGGKIEAGETSPDAMKREFAEETTQHGPPAWHLFASLSDGATFSVQFFAAIGEPDYCGSRESEQVEVINVEGIHAFRKDMIENLPWLINLAVDFLEDGRPHFSSVSYPTAQ